MIRYLKGKIILEKEKFIVLDVNGVGYKIFISQKTLFKLKKIVQNKENKGNEKTKGGFANNVVEMFCSLDVGENILDLYGFLNEKELEFFETLKNIRGVGSKASLEIASLGPLEKIKEKILSQDEKLFEGIPRIGKKKAMAIILELTGKIRDISKRSILENKTRDEAEEGLVNLGFSREKSKVALSKVPKGVKGVEQRIKESLKILGK